MALVGYARVSTAEQSLGLQKAGTNELASWYA